MEQSRYFIPQYSIVGLSAVLIIELDFTRGPILACAVFIQQGNIVIIRNKAFIVRISFRFFQTNLCSRRRYIDNIYSILFCICYLTRIRVQDDKLDIIGIIRRQLLICSFNSCFDSGHAASACADDQCQSFASRFSGSVYTKQSTIPGIYSSDSKTFFQFLSGHLFNIWHLFLPQFQLIAVLYLNLYYLLLYIYRSFPSMDLNRIE